MDDRSTTRRSFFGLAGGAALLCTIGGEEVEVSSSKGLEKADAVAAKVRRPRAAIAQDVPQIQPAPGGVRREYWIQAETVRWDITPIKRDEWHNRKLSSRNGYRAYVYRQMTPGFAAPAGGDQHPRPDAQRRGRRRARRALPQRRPQAAPGGHHAPARRQVQPRVRRRLHGRVHARGRLHRPGRDVHVPVGVHAGLRRRLAVPRPRAQPHAEHVPRPVRGGHRPARAAPSRRTARTRCSPTSCRRRSPASSATSSA